MKREPAAYSIADLKRDGRTSWHGIRNYQARNFMRDEMSVGDLVLSRDGAREAVDNANGRSRLTRLRAA